TETVTAAASSPRRISEPCPNWRSICVKAALSAAPLAASRPSAALSLAALTRSGSLAALPLLLLASPRPLPLPDAGDCSAVLLSVFSFPVSISLISCLGRGMPKWPPRWPGNESTLGIRSDGHFQRPGGGIYG